MNEMKAILLAEDSPSDAELTIEALAEHRLSNRVTHVRDGVEALEYLRCEGSFRQRGGGNPAVIILDIQMPRMGGIEVLRAIRSDATLKNIPVVILTSSREEQDLVRSYELGTNAYVVKPVTFVDFVAAVKSLGLFWAVLNEQPL